MYINCVKGASAVHLRKALVERFDHPSSQYLPFHRVAVDVLTMPLTSRGNQYIVVFMDYFTKWAEAFAVPDQQASTIATLLVDHIVCRSSCLTEELIFYPI